MAGVTIDPFNWLRGMVVLADIAHELALEIGDGSKDAACDDIAFDAVEPQLDLVKPRGVGGRVVELDIRMGGEEGAHRRGLMGGEIIADDMDLLGFRLVDDQISQKGYKFRAGVPGHCLA